MKFLSRRRENEIVSHIKQAQLAHELEIQARDEMLVAATKHIAQLHDALKNAVRLQREIAEAFLASRENPEADIEVDLEGMLEVLSDQIANLEEHLA